MQHILVSLLLTATLALPSYEYQRPLATDERGPCPGLNTLANHGYINRSGRNIAYDALIDAATKAYSVYRRVFCPDF